MFIRLSLYLLAGILLGFSFTVNLRLSLVITISCLLFFLIAYYRSSRLIFPDIIFGIVTFLLVASVGFTAVHLRQPENINSHYTNFDNEAGQILKAEVSGNFRRHSIPIRKEIPERVLGRSLSSGGRLSLLLAILEQFDKRDAGHRVAA